MADYDDSLSGELWFSGTDWAKLLHLAAIFGYDPFVRGPDEAITPEELASIAMAVEDALDDVPNHNATGGKTASQMSPLEWFSGPRKQRLRDFLHFCKESKIL